MRVGRDVPRDPPDVVQKTMLPLDGPHQTSMSRAYFPVPHLLYFILYFEILIVTFFFCRQQ